MKHLSSYVLLLLLAVLAACNSRQSQEMEAALEQAKAVYGDGSLELEVDTVLFIPGLNEAPAYFAKKKQYDKAALAALLNGYSEKDFDKEAAMLSFKEAEHYGGLAHDSITQARAEYWMGKFLYEEGGVKDALSTFLISNKHIGNNYTEKAYIENGLAVTYMLLKQFDSTSYYLQKSLVCAQNSQLDKLERKTLNNFSVLYRIQGDYDRALYYIKTFYTKPYIDNEEEVLAYLNIGNIFSAEGIMDSAAYYFDRLESVLQNAGVKDETKVATYGALLKFAEKQGCDSLALRYREKHEDALFDVMNHRQERAVLRIKMQYDYETLQNAMNQKIIQRHKIILLFSVLLLFFAIVIIIQQYRHKQMLKAEDEMRQHLESLKEDLSQIAKSSVLDSMVVSQLKKIIIANRIMSRTKDPQNAWRPLILEVMAGKEKMFEAAQAVIQTAYPNLYSIILEKHPELSETELKVCILSCFDLSNSEIAELLDLKTNTVNQTRTILRKKLNLKSEKLNEQLRKFVSE